MSEYKNISNDELFYRFHNGMSDYGMNPIIRLDHYNKNINSLNIKNDIYRKWI